MVAAAVSIDTHHDDMIHDAQMDFFGKKLATCSSDRTIKIYDITGDVQKEEQVLTGHDGPVWQVQWSHPKFGVLLASCSYDGTVIVFRESQPTVWSQLHVHRFHESSVNSIAWAPYEYGLCLACGSADGKVSILMHTAEGWTTNHFQDSTLGCNAVSWAPFSSLGGSRPDGTPIMRLVTASCDNTVKLWTLDPETNAWSHSNLTNTQPHTDWVRDAAWAPSTGLPCNTIASCSEDRTVYIWTQCEANGAWNRELLHTFEAPVWRVSWSITGNVLAVSSGDHKVTLWKESLNKKWSQISSVDENGGLEAMQE